MFTVQITSTNDVPELKQFLNKIYDLSHLARS